MALNRPPSYIRRPTPRRSFSKIRTFVELPNLIEVQRRSFERFLQMNLPGDKRENVGLKAVFQSVFPITDLRDTCELQFVDYTIGNWECKCSALLGSHHLPSNCGKCGHALLHDGNLTRNIACQSCGVPNRIRESCDECGDPVSLKHKYTVRECQERGMTYSVPLKVTFRLVLWDKDPVTGQKAIRDIKEQEVYFGEIPMMTERGTFIINGTERVIVNQLHRSPGVFFQANDQRTEFVAKLIPYRGSWVEFEYDVVKQILYVRIDRKRKFPASTFLRALGLETSEAILRQFGAPEALELEGETIRWVVSPGLVGQVAAATVKAEGETIASEGKRFTRASVAKLEKAGVRSVPVLPEGWEGVICVADVVNRETGEVLLEANDPVTPQVLARLASEGLRSIEVAFPLADQRGPLISNTLRKDLCASKDEALVEIYRRIRPGDPPTLESSRNLFNGMFFDAQRYDLSRVGRLKFNTKLALETSLDERLLRPVDFFAVLDYLMRLQDPKFEGAVDDIDHLGNRRVRSVGELLENQFRIGLVRMEIAIKEKMSIYREMTTAMPQDIVNAKPVMAAVQEFFGSSQLSQFMDQTNPLSEVTHKRRLSALGPGGLSRERAGFEVRDVHPTHYGRICPIETPEGPNIGLISSLSCYARINEFGFIESPYRKVDVGRVVDHYRIADPQGTRFKVGEIVDAETLRRELGFVPGDGTADETAAGRASEVAPHCFYLSAWEEDKYVIAQANVPLKETGEFEGDLVTARKGGATVLTEKGKVDYIDVSPKQLVSVATALIPFLENDDANRALMGSNMQRQAVPLLRSEAPIVGTGMEEVAALNSGAVISCRRDGVVDVVDGQRIIVRISDADARKGKDFYADIYPLVKFKRSNQNTCINQKPIVEVGQHVKAGQVLADGPCTDMGELALGRNVLVAFMPWRGYNFEDAIIISEKLVRDDMYTSLHIEEFEVEARDTKLGPEEITRDIPNVPESALKDLDENGIIRIGAYVRPGDVLTGRITPKGETQLTPEEKLLRAIFGEKSGEVRDASLTCPPGIEGTVVEVQVFTRKGIDKDSRALAIEQAQVDAMNKNLEDEIRILREENRKKIIDVLSGKKAAADVVDSGADEPLVEKGGTLRAEKLERIQDLDVLRSVKVQDVGKEVGRRIAEIEQRTQKKIDVSRKLVQEKVEAMTKGDELAPGVRKLVKVYVAMKRKISVGDKMAGRHGNKGVIAKVLPEEDMPFLPDGTPVEIVLNPLGVPSRMNVGQILETHLGWVGRAMGMRFATPVFDGATEAEIRGLLSEARMSHTGKTVLIDGTTGRAFEQPVTVGYIYMLKLSHMVDDKIHARSIGPYSLITQQPLGGKAQFGGQRFGEMEVWALEAYGAAHTLQELLTAKSDDVYGRTKIYEALVKGEVAVLPGLPESFNVLLRELQSLCLDVELLSEPTTDIAS
jgi:DNA-directed RNA polymerase subunit beta